MPRHDAAMPCRRSVRLPGYDYSGAGTYFITICTHCRACLFGEIRRGVMHVNQAGGIVERAWVAVVDGAAHCTHGRMGRHAESLSRSPRADAAIEDSQ